MFYVYGEVAQAKVETIGRDGRKYGRVLLLGENGRDTALVTGQADFAEAMREKRDTSVSLPVRVEVNRFGELAVRHDRAKDPAFAKQADVAPDPATTDDVPPPVDGDAPPAPAGSGRKRGG